MRSCGSLGGYQGSLILVSALAELVEPHRTTLLNTFPGGVSPQGTQGQGLRALGSGSHRFRFLSLSLPMKWK